MDIQRDGALEYFNFYVHCFNRFSGLVTFWVLKLKLQEYIVGFNFLISNCKSWKTLQNGLGENLSGPIEKAIGKTTKYTVIYGIIAGPLVAPFEHLENRNSKRYWLLQKLLGSAYDTSPGIFASALFDSYVILMLISTACFSVLVGVVYATIVTFSEYAYYLEQCI
ncbi:hypothetical protein Ocin01_17224 [Orchesella cincta]|uniref:Uncharacterized protein n=1 Tax=Orchesella cincta TaxID=48709 RepID=A0A1D2M911_ORCCI|nr:hypothetical protein Ocin01_17224 [Orchesella cincta]